MTARLGFFRRVREWFWRSQRLRELKAQRSPTKDTGKWQQAQAYRALAWRTLGGLEPVPAETRSAIARPLLRAGIESLLALRPTPCPSLDALFDDPTWQRVREASGIPPTELPEVRAWLGSDHLGNAPRTAERALLLLDALIDGSDEIAAAIMRVRLWRLGIVSTVLAVLGAAAGLVIFLTSPPEGQDIAVGKPWRASSAYVGYSTEGRKPERPGDVMFFCTNEDDGPWWQIDLQTPQKIERVTLVNRGDCCAERAIPLVIEISMDGQSWREVLRREDSFRTWRAKFKPTPARYLRLRALRRTFLHMKDVRIMTPSAKR